MYDVRPILLELLYGDRRPFPCGFSIAFHRCVATLIQQVFDLMHLPASEWEDWH